MSQIFNMDVLRFLGHGLLVTLFIAFSTIGLSFVFGSILGILRFSSKGILGKLAGLYIETVRNIPLLLFIISFRFTLPLPALASAIAAMTVFTSAMVAEIVRGGLNSVPHGQWEAANSQGFTFSGAMIHIILPQAVRKILVPLMGQFVTAIKDTSFCWVVGIEELMGAGMIIMGKFVTASQVIMMYALIAVIYYCVNSLVIYASTKIKF